MTRRNRLRTWAFLTATCCGAAFVAALQPMLSHGEDLEGATADERFVESLASGREGPADPRRLAKLFFGLASTLDGGRTNVRLLQSVVSDRDPGAATARTTLSNSFQHYEKALSALKDEVSVLIDRPESAARLYRTLTAGYRTCWQLDNYLRLVQTHGASGAEMITVVPTIESCRRFRRVAHQPRVETLILDALSPVPPAEEIRAIREELRAMEELLEDLRRIDEEDSELPR